MGDQVGLLLDHARHGLFVAANLDHGQPQEADRHGQRDPQQELEAQAVEGQAGAA